MLRPVATPKAVQLVLEPATEAACRRVGDARRLRQILGHLVDNAVKFTRGGVVRVRVTEDHVAPGSAAVRIDVEDCGTGIAPELLARIFEKFTQADDSSTRLHGGLGLGLAITRLLVRAMGGTLAVTSTLGSGSTFSVLLPLEAQDDVNEPEAVHHGDHLRGLRVLVADDNEVNRLLVVRLLRRLGCKTQIACNGAEALQVSPLDYDLVLMDCQMPVMDGFEAARAMRQREAEGLATRKPIIAVTASVTAHDRLRCSDHGMDDYMTKPLTGIALKQMMLRHLGLAWRASRPLADPPAAIAVAMAAGVSPLSGS
jgi:CheY-like chemotaxis protein